VLTNTSDSRCALAGHPAVWFTSGGSTLGKAALERSDSRLSEEHGLKAVVVAPKGRAYVQLDYYLPRYYPANGVAKCAAITVRGMRIDLANDLAGTAQQGTFDVTMPATTGCTNSSWGIYGKYGQLSTTVFVGYSLTEKR